MLVMLLQLLGCGGEKTPMSYWTKSHQPRSVGSIRIPIPSPATPQRFGKHKLTLGSDLWGEAADIRIEPPSPSMPLPGAAASLIKSCVAREGRNWGHWGKHSKLEMGKFVISTAFLVLCSLSNKHKLRQKQGGKGAAGVASSA